MPHNCPRRIPPSPCPAQAVQPLTLSADTEFFRTFETFRGAFKFNPTVRTGSGGTRFGPTKVHRNPVWYAGLSERLCVAETLLKKVVRMTLSPSDIAGLSLISLKSKQPLQFADLSERGPLQLWCADRWITRCDENGYPITRRWPPYLLSCDGAALGLGWTSNQNVSGISVSLYRNQVGSSAVLANVFDVAWTVDFDTPVGRLYIEDFLYTNFGVSIR